VERDAKLVASLGRTRPYRWADWQTRIPAYITTWRQKMSNFRNFLVW